MTKEEFKNCKIGDVVRYNENGVTGAPFRISSINPPLELVIFSDGTSRAEFHFSVLEKLPSNTAEFLVAENILLRAEIERSPFPVQHVQKAVDILRQVRIELEELAANDTEIYDKVSDAISELTQIKNIL